jgi:hypothetical protein
MFGRHPAAAGRVLSQRDYHQDRAALIDWVAAQTAWCRQLVDQSETRTHRRITVMADRFTTALGSVEAGVQQLLEQRAADHQMMQQLLDQVAAGDKTPDDAKAELDAGASRLEAIGAEIAGTLANAAATPTGDGAGSSTSDTTAPPPDAPAPATSTDQPSDQPQSSSSSSGTS